MTVRGTATRTADGIDPWVLEAERTAGRDVRRPEPGPAPTPALVILGLLAALRAVGLVLVAEGVARRPCCCAAGSGRRGGRPAWSWWPRASRAASRAWPRTHCRRARCA